MAVERPGRVQIEIGFEWRIRKLPCRVPESLAPSSCELSLGGILPVRFAIRLDNRKDLALFAFELPLLKAVESLGNRTVAMQRRRCLLLRIRVSATSEIAAEGLVKMNGRRFLGSTNDCFD